jgi:hypothetical protein
MEAFNRLAPLASVGKVIPVGNQVSKRTAVVTKGNSAVHAPACLALQVELGKRLRYLFPVPQTNRDRATLGKLSLVLDESTDISHYRFSLIVWSKP